MYTPYVFKLSTASIVPVFVGIFIGSRINKNINQQSFLKLVYVLLMISGGLLIFNAL